MTKQTCPQCGSECNVLGTCAACGDADTTTLPPPSTAGTVVLDGRYRVDSLLGRGGMGAVYEGYDTSLNRRVAIKFLADPLRADPRIVQRFRREAEALAAVEHRVIVPIYAVGEQDGCPYFVMRYVDGRDLFRWTRESGRLSLPQVVNVGVALCDGLEQIHKVQFVHRDIKPANVMVQPDGSAMVLDFGILRTTGSELTRTGYAIGSPKFMAPEQGRDARTADARSDLYSLGATLYYALTGNAPFSGSSDYEILVKHHDEPLTPPSRLLASVAKPVDRFFAKAMAKAPADRFQSAADFRTALLTLAPADWQASHALALRSPRRARRAWFVGGAAVIVAGLIVWAERPLPPQPIIAVPDQAPGVSPHTVQAAPAAETPLVRRPPPSAGYLRVVTTDGGEQLWADITVDGRHVGLSPITELKLPAGRHIVRARREGYAASEQTIEIRADERLKVTLELRRGL